MLHRLSRDRKWGGVVETRSIVITEFDRARLIPLIREVEASGARDDLSALRAELDRARVVEPSAVPSDVVTMNSRVVLVDRESSERMEITLVFPEDGDADAGRISVLAPVGTAIIGYRAGDTVEWPVPSGVRQLHIEAVSYQPEAAGDMDL
jgi:regulator of nucleoside diphosphate kinase